MIKNVLTRVSEDLGLRISVFIDSSLLLMAPTDWPGLDVELLY